MLATDEKLIGIVTLLEVEFAFAVQSWARREAARGMQKRATMARTLWMLGSLVLTTFSSWAGAEPPKPTAADAAKPVQTAARETWSTDASAGIDTRAERQKPGAHLHEGFYLRLATGFGAFGDTLSARESGGSFDEAGHATGVATANEIAVGGMISRRLVLGGGFYQASVLASDFEPDDPESGELPADVDPTGVSIAVVGPFVDYYFNPRDGFHLQVAPGLAMSTGYRYDVARFDGDEVAFGGGVMFGVGYEWWMSDEWSIGVLGRGTVAVVAEEDEEGTDWLHGIGTFPTVLLSATYN